MQNAGEQVWKDDKCEMRVWVPVPGVAVFTGKGNVQEALFVSALPVLRAAFPPDVAGAFFCDGWEIDGYESKFRLRITELVQSLKPRGIEVHVLMRSKIVAMGFSVANLVLGGDLTGHRDQKEFYRLVEQTVARVAKPS